jgi:hypothetical protein
MKRIVSCLITVTFLFTLFSCEKDLFISRKFVGSWKILTPDSDTITFNDKSSFTRKYNDGVDHTFKYSYLRMAVMDLTPKYINLPGSNELISIANTV